MIKTNPQRDRALRIRLERFTECNRDYWSFKGNSCREYCHGFFQYPAMMVPQMVRALLKEAHDVHPEMEWVGDPFSGSGTILTESMLQGFNFSGKDINPLAVLLCKVKAGPFFPNSLNSKISLLNNSINEDCKSRIEVDFPGRNKWFNKDIQIALSKIRRAIIMEPSLWARRFFWIGIAETVRLCSNSRTSTFKLHIRSDEDLNSRSLDPISIFIKINKRNLEGLSSQTKYLVSDRKPSIYLCRNDLRFHRRSEV